MLKETVNPDLHGGSAQDFVQNELVMFRSGSEWKLSGVRKMLRAWDEGCWLDSVAAKLPEQNHLAARPDLAAAIKTLQRIGADR